jgi:glutamate-1-semialdehyde 2,1-aminomutase
MSTLFFCGSPVTDYPSALQSDTGRFAIYFSEMLAQGVYLPPSQFEAAFLSSAHSMDDIASTLKANRSALERVAQNLVTDQRTQKREGP